MLIDAFGQDLSALGIEDAGVVEVSADVHANDEVIGHGCMPPSDDEDQKRFADVKEKLPNLAGKIGIVSQFAQGSFGAVADPEDPGASFIYDLGMKFPDKLTDGTVPVDKGRVTLSPENVSYLAADFMVIYNRTGSIEEVENTPGYKDLPQVNSGATLAGDEAVVAGLNNPTSLSRAWVLDKTMPTLEKVGK